MSHTRSISPDRSPRARDQDTKPNLVRKASNKTPTSDDETKPHKHSRTKVASSATGPRARPWSADEYLALFEAVTKHGVGPKAFANVPGRTARQASSAWRDVVGPACRQALVAKAAKRGPPFQVPQACPRTRVGPASGVVASEDNKPDLKPKSKATSHASTSGSTVRRPWTGDEYVQLFDRVMAHGTGSKSFAAAVPGRSSNQAAMAWRDVVRPKCREMLLAKGKRSR
ncbi:hypothetical protein CspeluHIS016_0505410 [Cutaneotrichosporon spelunceum]|uniref:Myb-like domain-containing protein n=1 Tax=Cutaneotrichosporon spelunceum TaxID=1672016 RepID=A0AAD3YE10_9TREE|nr:hypothetical protein CspeluHIS016_0505410 [Cutaneotrichosporon spelunceum]